MKKTIAILAMALGCTTLAGSNAFADPECISQYGQTACGYNCVAQYGNVKCSRSPQGACAAQYGNVVCWDPAPWINEKAECISQYGNIACGYNCVAQYGVVKCAQTPEGVCKAEYGKVTCWDPEYGYGYR